MFEKTLPDLIRGIRANKKNEQEYIVKCIDEIRKELKTDDMTTKTVAISKLNYLQMLGYDFSWAAFHVVEVMSSPNVAQKRIGYLAAGQCFRQETEVLMLVTNLVKKDLGSSMSTEVEIALEGVSQFMTPDLAQFLCQDILNLLSHSQPCVRKRAILTLYKVFLRFPEGVRLCYPRLKELLDDADSSVANAAVHVICELARKAPQNYLALVPIFYRLLEGPFNCWMFIKLAKLFGVLTPIEPRLIKKMSGPFQRLIDTTTANSFLAELINTAVVGGYLSSNEESSVAMARSCVIKLGQLMDDQDQNLKYVALVILVRLLPLCPEVAFNLTHKVLMCLDDFDYSIRVRALELASLMVTQKDLIPTVRHLVGQLVGDQLSFETSGRILPAHAQEVGEPPMFLVEGSFRQLVVKSILTMCSRDKYSNVPNFEWYVATLIDLVYISKVDVGELIGEQLLNVAVRVQSVREYVLQGVCRLLSDTTLLIDSSLPESNVTVLESAAWIAGEYASLLSTPGLLLPRFYARDINHLAPKTQAVYIHAGLKVLVAHGRHLNTAAEWLEAIHAFSNGLSPFTLSQDTDLQERACNTLCLLQRASSQLEEYPDQKQTLVEELAFLFSSYELNAVAAKAQSKVTVPPELDLNAWIGEPPPKVESSYPLDVTSPKPDPDSDTSTNVEKSKAKEKRKARRRRQRKDDPFYIGNQSDSEVSLPEIDSIPIVRLDSDIASGLGLESLRLAKSLGRKLKSKKRTAEAPVIADGEMPNGEVGSDTEPVQAASSSKGFLESEATSLVGVDLTKPLEEGESLPQIKAYLRPDQVLAQQQQLNWDTKDKKKAKRKSKGKSKDRSKFKSKTKAGKEPPALIDLEAPQTQNLPSKRDEPATIILEFDPRDWGTKRKVLLIDSEEVQLGALFWGNTASFYLANPHSTQGFQDCELVFLDTSAIKVEGLDNWNTIKLAERVTPGENCESKSTLSFSPADQDHLKDGIYIDGSLAYVQSDVLTRTSINFRLSIPTLAWMEPSPTQLSPDGFSDLIASSPEDFQHTYRADFSKTLDNPITAQNACQLFDKITSHLSSNFLGMTVIQLISGTAASLYGTTIFGTHIVALIKLQLSPTSTTKQLSLSLEFKGQSTDILEALSNDLKSILSN